MNENVTVFLDTASECLADFTALLEKSRYTVRFHEVIMQCFTRPRLLYCPKKLMHIRIQESMSNSENLY